MNEDDPILNESLLDAALALAPPELDDELRRIMEQINLELPGEPGRTIMVTAAQRGEGVSTIACWLSAAFATAYLGDILYLDANSDSSRQRDSNVKAGTQGLLELVREPDRREAIYQKTAVPNLLTMRAWTSRTAIQITDQQVAQAMAMLRKRFAYVVIDAEAPLASPLTMTLARHSGGTLIVVEANKTDRTLVAETGALLRRSGARIIGAVVNKGGARIIGAAVSKGSMW